MPNCLMVDIDEVNKNRTTKGVMNVSVRNAHLETPLHLAAHNGIC